VLWSWQELSIRREVHLPLMDKEREDVDFPLRIQSKIIRFSEKTQRFLNIYCPRSISRSNFTLVQQTVSKIHHIALNVCLAFDLNGSNRASLINWDQRKTQKPLIHIDDFPNVHRLILAM